MGLKEGGTMLKIAICDDEKEFQDAAERMLKLYMEEKGLPFEIDSFDVASDLIDTLEKGMIYDIYLLDIYMPGMTGMPMHSICKQNGASRSGDRELMAHIHTRPELSGSPKVNTPFSKRSLSPLKALPMSP